MRFVPAALTLLFLGALYGCSQDGSTTFDNARTYFSTVTAVDVDVFYEPAAEPFTGSFSALAPTPFKSRDFWDLTEENLKAVFEGRGVTITVPKATSAMTRIPAQNRTSWTAEDLVALWTGTRKAVSTATQAHLYLVFLDGYYSSEGQPQTEVIGVNVVGTPITAIFKQVVESTSSNPNNRVAKYVEQTTIIHELSHALGLVNGGIPMTAAHQDTANGAHCTNDHCVMYYLNEGRAAMIQFVLNAESTGSLVVLGSECLEDAHRYRP